jgi:hypothetical protein
VGMASPPRSPQALENPPDFRSSKPNKTLRFPTTSVAVEIYKLLTLPVLAQIERRPNGRSVLLSQGTETRMLLSAVAP